MKSPVTLLLIAIAPATISAQESFRGLGATGPGRYSSAIAASNGGSTIVGNYFDGTNEHACFWDAEGVHDLAVPSGTNNSRAVDVSSLGNVIVGSAVTASGTVPLRWNSPTQFIDLGFPVPGAGQTFRPAGISSDGLVIVGQGWSGIDTEAYSLNQSVWTRLATLTGGNREAYALTASSDGSTVVGYGTIGGVQVPVRWSQGQATEIGYIGAFTYAGVAYATSADGSIVVGNCGTVSGARGAFRYKYPNQMLDLGDVSGGPHQTRAYDVSGDGNSIVGAFYISNQSPLEAFLWQPNMGMQRLKDYLLERDVTEVSGWSLVTANGISADGRTVVGRGVNPEGNREAFVANIGATVTGRIFFSDLARYSIAPSPIEFQLREPGKTVPFQTIQSPLLANDGFDMRGLPPRAMDISVKPAHWLRRTITIDTTEHNVLDLSIYLDNGDVEDDNEVNLADYSALATAFGSAAGDENWNPMSDLNGDDEISLADCSILARNFGLAGND